MDSLNDHTANQTNPVNEIAKRDQKEAYGTQQGTSTDRHPSHSSESWEVRSSGSYDTSAPPRTARTVQLEHLSVLD